MFSIQTASTGPSKTTHFLYLFSESYAHFLIIIAITPSVQLLVFGSSLPYNWSEVIDFGFNFSCTTFVKFPYPAKELIPYASTYVTLDFPEYAAPTTINPCLTFTVS
jgi:hypothetical protein